MFVNCRNLSLLLRFVAGVLFLLLPPQTAGAVDAVLCNRAGVDPDAAIPACTRLLDRPSAGTKVPAVYNQRGVAKVRKGDLEDAIADFTSALDRDPNYADAFKNRGIARQMQDDYDGAIADFSRALRLNDKSPDFYNARGTALFKKGEYDSAIRDFGTAISLDPNYKKAYVNRGLAFHFKRQLDRAIADFDIFVRLAPNDVTGYLDRASVRMDKGDFKGALDDCNQAIRLDPNNAGPWTRRGEAWRLQGNLQQSVEDNNKAIALDPREEEAYNNRALTFKDQGNLDKAIEDCDQAIMLNPKFYLAYANRGLIRRLKGDLGGSLADLDKAVKLDPRLPTALTFRGDTLREMGDNERAMKDFNDAKHNVPDFVAAYTGEGLSYEQKGDLAKAKTDFETALGLSADLDAGLARPAQDLARARLVALAAEQDKRDKQDVPTATLPKPEPAKLVPDDIRQALYHRGHALLIGVANYTNGWPQLPSVKDDLHNLEEGLHPHFDTVDIVPSPTVAEIRAKMREFLLGKWNKENERLFIYYSGHGFPDFNQSSQQKDGYITGSDTPLPNSTDNKAIENAVQFGEVEYLSRQTRAKHVLMVFDACFSGSLFAVKGTETEPNKYEFDGIRRMLGQPIRYFITAGRESEEVSADSTFAKLLLRGLRGEADFFHEGIISADQLGIYLGREVPRNSHRTQTPQFNSIGNVNLSEGQFFFLTEPAAAR